MLTKILGSNLDEGSQFFEPSTLVATTISANNNANNVIPSEVKTSVNIRFNDNHSSHKLIRWLQQECNTLIEDTKTDIKMDVKVSGESFYTEPKTLAHLVRKSVEKVSGITPVFSTSGGTSDARFIYKICPVVEFGLVGAKMHSLNESIPTSQIIALEEVYFDLIQEHSEFFHHNDYK